MKTRLQSFFLILMVAFAGCAKTTDEGAKKSSDGGSGSESKGIIGVSLLTLQNPFFKVIGDNITAEAEKNGYETIVLSAEESVETQGDQVKDFIVKGCAAIVMSPCEPDAIGPIIREANKASIPVFTVDIPCKLEDVEIACQISTDNYSGGVEAATAMIEALGDQGGKVGVLHYNQAQSCQLRVAGFTKGINDHNEKAANKIEIIEPVEGGANQERSHAATQDLLQAHPDMVGIFAINDPSALGAYSALKSAQKTDQIKIVGFDGQKMGKEAIRDGKVYADPIQFPDIMGQRVVQEFIKHSLGEEIEKEILIPTKLYRKADAENDPELQ